MVVHTRALAVAWGVLRVVEEARVVPGLLLGHHAYLLNAYEQRAGLPVALAVREVCGACTVEGVPDGRGEFADSDSLAGATSLEVQEREALLPAFVESNLVPLARVRNRYGCRHCRP